MKNKKIFARLFEHRLEQPRSILCFYAAWPIALILSVIGVADFLAGKYPTVAVEAAGAVIFFLVPPLFKTEHHYSLVRGAFSLVVFSGFLVTLLTRLGEPTGLMWLPLFPIFAYILLGARIGHPMVIVMWTGYLLLAPFELLGIHDSILLTAAFAISTVIANKYEWALAMHHERLSHLAEKDPLTGIANRRAILAYLDSLAIKNARLSVLMIDIDHFKAINDELGHTAGDQALCRVGDTIASQLREEQRAGRLGGDEFLVVLPEVDLQLAEQIANRLLQKLYLEAEAKVSIGVAQCDPEETSHSLIHRADQALYQAKAAGRNQLASATA